LSGEHELGGERGALAPPEDKIVSESLTSS
jgi:hypothetical protein